MELNKVAYYQTSPKLSSSANQQALTHSLLALAVTTVCSLEDNQFSGKEESLSYFGYFGFWFPLHIHNSREKRTQGTSIPC